MHYLEGSVMISMNRLILMFTSIFLITCFLSGCAIGSNNDEPSAAAAKTNTVDANDTSEAVIKDKIEHKEYINKSSLGSAAFKIDESNSVTKEFLADGGSTTLELTDKSGIKWTLAIPEDALLYPQTITMTALAVLTVYGKSTKCNVF